MGCRLDSLCRSAGSASVASPSASVTSQKPSTVSEQLELRLVRSETVRPCTLADLRRTRSTQKPIPGPPVYYRVKLVVRNDSSKTCRLRRYPLPQFYDAEGDRVPFKVRHVGRGMGGSRKLLESDQSSRLRLKR